MGLGSYNDGSRGDKDHFATSPNCVTELKVMQDVRYNYQSDINFGFASYPQPLLH